MFGDCTTTLDPAVVLNAAQITLPLCSLQGVKKYDVPCGGRDCSGGCQCYPEKGGRVSTTCPLVSPRPATTHAHTHTHTCPKSYVCRVCFLHSPKPCGLRASLVPQKEAKDFLMRLFPFVFEATMDVYGWVLHSGSHAQMCICGNSVQKMHLGSAACGHLTVGSPWSAHIPG